MEARLIVCSLCLACGVATAAPSQKYSSDQYLRNYALAVCLAAGYEAAEIKQDASASARGYFEFGGYSIEAHNETVQLAKTFLKREYPSESGQPLTLMKCIDFSHSKELATLMRRHLHDK